MREASETQADGKSHQEQELREVVLQHAGGPEVLTVERRALPVPAGTQLLIRSEASGVAFIDVLTRQGLNAGALPRVPGFDVVGRVVALGPRVTAVKVGDRVGALMLTGGYASHILAPEAVTVPIADDLDAAEADALLLNYTAAWLMLHEVAKVRKGQTILVLGAGGGVGGALVQLAAAAGVQVYGTSGAARRAVAESNGATWLPAASELPDPVDATFDPVGGPSLRTSRAATSRRGVVVSYGLSFVVGAGYSRLGGLLRTAAALALARLTPGPRTKLFLIETAMHRHPERFAQTIVALTEMLRDGRIRPEVTRVPLEDVSAAHRLLEERRARGKVVLIP